MRGDASLGYWSYETSHSSSHHCNDDEISDNEILEVSSGDGRRGNRSLETSHYYSRNHRGYHSSDVSKGGCRLQETRHSSSFNRG